MVFLWTAAFPFKCYVLVSIVAYHGYSNSLTSHFRRANSISNRSLSSAGDTDGDGVSANKPGPTITTLPLPGGLTLGNGRNSTGPPEAAPPELLNGFGQNNPEKRCNSSSLPLAASTPNLKNGSLIMPMIKPTFVGEDCSEAPASLYEPALSPTEVVAGVINSNRSREELPPKIFAPELSSMQSNLSPVLNASVPLNNGAHGPVTGSPAFVNAPSRLPAPPADAAPTFLGYPPIEACGAMYNGTAPTTDPSATFLFELRLLHTTTKAKMILTFQAFLDDEFKYQLAGCVKRRMLQREYITNIEFYVMENFNACESRVSCLASQITIVANLFATATNCGSNGIGACLPLAVETKIYHTGATNTNMTVYLENALLAHCGQFKYLDGVVATCDPCPSVFVEQLNDNYTLTGAIGGGGRVNSFTNERNRTKGTVKNISMNSTANTGTGGVAAVSAGVGTQQGIGVGGTLAVVASGVVLILLLLVLIKQSQQARKLDVKHQQLEEDESDTFLDDLELDTDASNILRTHIVGDEKSANDTADKHSLSDSVGIFTTSDDVETTYSRDSGEYDGHHIIRRTRSADASMGSESVAKAELDFKSKIHLNEVDSDDSMDRWYFSGKPRGHQLQKAKHVGPYYMAQGPLESLDNGHLGQDVHMCSSATCELCERRRREGSCGLRFISTKKSKRANSLPPYAAVERKYVSNDTIDL